MAQTRPCDVSPTGDQDKYTVALMKESGEWWGLDVPLTQIHPSTVNPPAPIQRVTQNSFHAGRGADRFAPNQYNFFESYNGWSTTPGKFHATPLVRWARGTHTSTGNLVMPWGSGVTWKPLTGTTRFLANAFGAGGSFTGTNITFILRRRVPAGTVGAPGTLTFEVRSDTGGNPGGVIASYTVTSSQITDVVSQYYTFTTSVPFTVGTFWLTLYGAAGDKNQACWEVGCNPAASGRQSSNGAAWSASSFAPYFKIDGAFAIGQYKPFIYDYAQYFVRMYDNGTTASLLFMEGSRGIATGTQSANTLQDTTHGAYGATNLPTNAFVDSYIRIIRGTGQGQVRRIVSNSADTYTVSPNWDITPVAASSEYVVYGSDLLVSIVSGLGVVTGTPVISNGIVYFPQGDGTNIRKMRIDYTDADDHAFVDDAFTNSNKAYFLESAFDTSKNEPILWRANQRDTTGVNPAKAISVSKASTSPAGTPISFGTDLTFSLAPIYCGDNSVLITGIYEHENSLYVMKEDGMYIVQNDRAVRVRMGTETAPDISNGRAACVGGDKNLYVAFRQDVYLISGGGAYSTGLKVNLPSQYSGNVVSLVAAEGWLFAAVNGGTDNYSSVFKYSLDTKSWSEHWRAPMIGQQIRNLGWQPLNPTRPRLWIDCNYELMFQEFPINGVRPYDDKQIPYQHEAYIILPTVDLESTDPKYFAVLSVTTQGLADVADTETGHEIVVECQTDNDVGTTNWEHVGYIRTSPTGSIEVNRGRKRMLRLRLRLISNEAIDPVILEIVSLTLFTRNRLAHEYSMQMPILSDDEEQNSVDFLMALRDMAGTAEPLTMLSRFTLFHNKRVTISDEPRYQISELEPTNNELEAQVWLKISEIL